MCPFSRFRAFKRLVSPGSYGEEAGGGGGERKRRNLKGGRGFQYHAMKNIAELFYSILQGSLTMHSDCSIPIKMKHEEVTSGGKEKGGWTKHCVILPGRKGERHFFLRTEEEERPIFFKVYWHGRPPTPPSPPPPF